jgi:parallel beta-helix repeat protein
MRPRLTNRLLVIATGLLGLVALSASSAAAATFYVRESGNDSNDGLAPSRALRTITRAAEKAVGRRPHVIYVGAGRYAEGNINPGGSGRPGEPLAFVADWDGSRTGDAGQVLVDATGFSNAFRISARQWVAINGFAITGAVEAGIDVKSRSERTTVANCTVFTNGARGIRVRDSAGVLVFNNLVYANGSTGIDFGGELTVEGVASDGTAIHNTVYANEGDGIRIEAVEPLRAMTFLNNVVTDNSGVGLNLKAGSATDYVGQWNLVSGNELGEYNTTEVARGELDIGRPPLFVAPAGTDGTLGGSGAQDDSFHLRQVTAGQGSDSPAVDASALSAKQVGLRGTSTRSDRTPDTGKVDLGFHVGAKADFVSGSGPSVERRIQRLRKRATKCAGQAEELRADRDRGRGACFQAGAMKRLAKRCGPVVEALCG